MLHLPTFEQLRQYVRQILCTRADLDAGTPMLERTIRRKGKPCGVEFTLLAGRSVRLSAIWETLEGRILFYSQDLERFLVVPVRGPADEQIETREVQQVQIASMWRGK
jgi:hypothetical protein